MIAKVLAVVGSGIVGMVVHITVITVTGSPYLSISAAGMCAFSLGIAAGRDGIWRD